MTHLSLFSIVSFSWVWWVHRVTLATFIVIGVTKTTGCFCLLAPGSGSGFFYSYKVTRLELVGRLRYRQRSEPLEPPN